MVGMFYAPTTFAQRTDTSHCHYDHAFAWQQTIAPVTLIATGAAITYSPLHTSLDGSIHDWSQRDGHDRFEIENGIQYIPSASVFLLKACGLKSQHSWRNLVCLEAGSAILAFTLNTGLKHTLDIERPYPEVYNSFPSGHTVTAFVGAEMLRREYGKEYPGIAIAGYTIATGVGLMRIYNNRHWASDVLAGAGVGILSVSIMYWLAPYLTF
jgi:hypothetical protein